MRNRRPPLSPSDLDSLAWEKMDGLLPAIVQDAADGATLMLGYMSRESLARTFDSGLVTFFSRSRQTLWTKGETSGNRLELVGVHADCDLDALLLLARPTGPVCHLGSDNCFDVEARGPAWLARLSNVVRERAEAGGPGSYTARLLAEGVPKIAQKVGEEGVEVALAAVARDRQGCAEEVADLLYHVTVLMQARGFGWDEVVEVLKARHRG